MKLALIAVGWLGGNRFLKATHNAQVGQSRWKFLAVCEKKNTPMFMGINKDNNSIQKKKKNSYIVSFLVI